MIVADEGRFALIYAQGSLANQVGKSVELSLSRVRTLKLTLPAAQQLALRYRTIDRTRELAPSRLLRR